MTEVKIRTEAWMFLKVSVYTSSQVALCLVGLFLRLLRGEDGHRRKKGVSLE